jgi:hypothetical protein
MKRVAVFMFVSLALASESFAVLRPRFPVKAMPPFNSDMIVRGDEYLNSLPERGSLITEIAAFEGAGHGLFACVSTGHFVCCSDHPGLTPLATPSSFVSSNR